MENLLFLKLGGSLITDKTRPRTVRPKMLAGLCAEIATVRAHDPNLLLLLGHGSGSFGHVAAKKYATREGLPPPSQPSPRAASPNGGKGERGKFSARRGELEASYWRGFTEVWHEAAELNKLVMDALREAGIVAMAIPPSASVIARAGAVVSWDLTPIKQAMSRGIMPVVYGDVVFDKTRGGTILSTEDLFVHLAREMRPQRVLLAGLEDGVYADFPARKHRVTRVTPASYEKIRSEVGASSGTDVTGGMDSKVKQMLALVTEIPALEVQLFSGKAEGNLAGALRGEALGTLIRRN